jgi:DNA-binding XRE family transcriptional regulator
MVFSYFTERELCQVGLCELLWMSCRMAALVVLWDNPRMSDLGMPPSSKKAIGRRLELTRESLGLNAGDFAKRAGIGKSAYSNYTSGERAPTLAQAIKLCDAYELTLDWIYRGDPSGLKYNLAEQIIVLRRKSNSSSRK